MYMRYMPRLFLLMAPIVISTSVHSQGAAECGSLESWYGPFDYRTATIPERERVDKFHFTAKVESLAGGSTAMTPGGDLNYTLRVFPNHPRALMATIRLSERQKRAKPLEMEYSVACWLDRAERFRPDDPTVQSIYGIYLLRSGNPKAALERFGAALQLRPNDANVYYNRGLTYFELGQFESALDDALRAYELGFQLPGLRDKLKRVGKWREPERAAATSGSSPRSQGTDGTSSKQ